MPGHGWKPDRHPAYRTEVDRRSDDAGSRDGAEQRTPRPGSGKTAASGVQAPMNAVMALQSAAGNRAVTGLLTRRGAGAGGAVKPSTFASDVGAVAQDIAGAHQQAGGAAGALLAAAPPPPGLPVAPEQALPELPAPGVAEPGGSAPQIPAADGDSVATGPTIAGLAAREQAEGHVVDAAGRDAGKAADALRIGPLGASAAIGVTARTPLSPVAAPPPDLAGIPAIEPAVARVLDNGFGGRLSAAAGAARQEQDAAVAHHTQVTGDARAAHDSAVDDQQAAADGEARELDARTAGEVDGHKQAWRAENSRVTADSRTELHTLRAGAGADIEQQAGAANSEAATIMSGARSEADRQGGNVPGPAVQRSLWGRIKSAAGRAVGAVRSGLSAVASAARSVLDAALNRVRGLFDRVRQAITDRVGRFVAAAREIAGRVGARLAAAAKAAVGAIRRAVNAARATFDRLVDRLREFAAGVLHSLWSALQAAGRWLRDRLAGLVRGLIAAGRAVLAFAGKVRELLRVTGHKVLSGLVRAVNDPGAFVAPYKAQVGGMIDTVPDKAHRMYDDHVAPLFGGDRQETPAAQRTVQRQETAEARQEGEPPSHSAILWEFLKARLSYLGGHWGSVILDVLLEIFVPFVSLYRHLPPMLTAAWHALKDLFAGRFSDAVDAGLKAARELMAILSTLFAQVSIAAFIAGSILGTPIVGEGAMLAVGLSLLAADVVLQAASIAKAWSNLGRPGRTSDELGDDYGVMADSVISLGITLALVLIAAIGQKLGKVLLARFPKAAGALAAIRERIKLRARAAAGLKNPPPTTRPVVDTPAAPAVARPAVEFPGRAGLLPGEQAAFDRFIAGQRASGNLSPQFETKLKAMTPDQLRRVAAREMGQQIKVEAAQEAQSRANATNQSNPLDPQMAHPPQDVGGNVRIRYNELPPSNSEIAQAQGIARSTGEPIELFGDGFGGIDGTIGRPPRPLQLKGPPQAGQAGAAVAYESAVVAHEKAVRFGFSDVETHITAPNVTRAEVAAEFARQGKPASYVGGGAVRRVVVYCKNGEIYLPPSTAVVPPPVHVDSGKDEARTPAGAGAGHAE
ncbi:hypothetical protein AMES_7235 [Amycolatopsis mediterranei S699]|uniref:HAMP domain-containing protein n=2 Tax=Amycolatopsis mediterranei TaxID=33910 RepID=A0A0H3DDP0_AMYMU|nr:hypothetical protein AMED_7346 [Amycolatopsis mediterranei U32]AEK46019.1 hypothetical protein RAM_37760 [Amycolatopsis mediterranei S699]AGT87896.1 hypothetical protein B737_7235 [Amycolatopsis mediterranei RB]KDO04039.1 hypothetical protein DV26_45990 [Amycolatopsis mediterranei]AFO80768.1 hypothetical protein AMES_7235 [Amycolatopsis mediterranei S699]